MPNVITPDGHVTQASCAEYSECPTCRSDISRFDRYWCEDCESSPCDCPEDNPYEDPYENMYESARRPWRQLTEEQMAYERDTLLQYSFTPTGGYTFCGDGPAYYGMEIEVTSNCDSGTLRYARDTLNTEHGTLAYLKYDGSVEGFEMVTQPMSYDWAMANFPWNVLEGLEARYCATQPAANGIHVHVSREAFSTPAHMYRWMKLLYRNQSAVQRIARRPASGWASFSKGHQAGQFEHAKNKGLGHDPTKAAGRYQAINTTNSETLEVRVFASSLNVAKAQSALQLVASTVEYTRELSSRHDCTDPRGRWAWGAYRDWLLAHAAVYPALADIERAHAATLRGEAAETLAAMRERRETARSPITETLAAMRERGEYRDSNGRYRDSNGRYRDSNGRYRDARGRFTTGRRA